MASKKKSDVITKTDFPEFFEILEKSLGSIRLPEIRIKESRICLTAQASKLFYSICFNKKFWNLLNLQEKVAVALHEIGHLNSVVFRYRLYFILVALLLIPTTFFIHLLYVCLLYIGYFSSELLSIPTVSFASMPFSMHLTVHFILYFICALVCIRFPLGIIFNISVRDEFAADRFAVQRIDKKHLINGINKVKEMKPTLFLRIIDYLLIKPFKTHPSNEERINRLLKEETRLG